MFYSRMVEYPVEEPSYIVDAYNHERVTYSPKGKSYIYMVLEDKTPQMTNELNTYTSNLVGYTQDMRIKEGWRIDGKYIVKSVLRHRTNIVLYLLETEDGK